MKTKLATCQKMIFILLVIVGCFFISACSNNQTIAFNSPSIDTTALAKEVRLDSFDLLEENFDHYATYFTVEEFEDYVDDFKGSFGGVGIYMTTTKESDYVQVFSVMPDEPAFKAGLQPGDYIWAVDGKSTKGMTLDEVSLAVKGEIGTQVTLTIQHEDGTKKDVEITRDLIDVKSVDGFFLQDHPDIAYFIIYDFAENTPDKFMEAYNELASERKDQAMPFSGIILDLRNNGGGSFYAALSIADLFVNSGEVLVWQETKEGLINQVSSDGQLMGVPLVCLQNQWSASASEVLLGALKDYQVATLVGETSYGKGITQLSYSLASGAAIRFTDSRYLTPLKNDIHGIGITPDYAVSWPEDKSLMDIYLADEKNDPQLQKAVQVLEDKIAAQTQSK